MDAQKENVLQIFNSIDKDGNGFLDKQEIQALAKELGQDISDDKVDKVFKTIDTDKDGKISFDEFFFWWFYGQKNGLEKLVKAKFQSTKMLKFLHKHASKKLGPFLQQKYEAGISEHFFQVNHGEFEESGFTFTAQLRGGEEHNEFAQKITDLFTYSDNIGQIYFWVKSSNPALFKEALENFINESLDLMMTFVPEEQQQLATEGRESLKIEVVSDDQNVYLRMFTQHPFAEEYVNQYANFYKQFAPPGYRFNFKAKIETKSNFAGIFIKKEETLVHLINQGVKASIDLQINSEYMEALRDAYIGMADKKIEKQNFDKIFKLLQSLIPLFMLDQSKVVINFNSFDNPLQDLELPEIAIASNNDVLGLLKSGAQPVQGLLAQIPFISDFIQVIKENCSSDIHFSVFQQDISFTVHQKSEGLGLIWDHITQ